MRQGCGVLSSLSELIKLYGSLSDTVSSALGKRQLQQTLANIQSKQLPVTSEVNFNDPKSARDISKLIGKYTGYTPKEIPNIAPKWTIDDEFPLPEMRGTEVSSSDDLHQLMSWLSRGEQDDFKSPYTQKKWGINPIVQVGRAEAMNKAFKPAANDMLLHLGISPISKHHDTSMLYTDYDRYLKGNPDASSFGSQGYVTASLDPDIAQHYSNLKQEPDPFDRIEAVTGPLVRPNLPSGSVDIARMLEKRTRAERNAKLPQGPMFRIMVPQGTPVLPVGETKGKFKGTFDRNLNYLLPPGSKFESAEQWDDFKNLLLTSPGDLNKKPSYKPIDPRIGWLAGMLPAGLLDKYSGDQQ